MRWLLPLLLVAVAACLDPAPLPPVEIDISPADPTANDELRVVLPDLGEAPVTSWSIRWFRDDAEIDALTDQETVSPEWTSAGETWAVFVALRLDGDEGIADQASVEVGAAGLRGTMGQEYDWSTELEIQGYEDCSSEAHWVDRFEAPEPGCPGCQAIFVAELHFDGWDCDPAWFDGVSPSPVELWQVGFGVDGMYFWGDFDQQWYWLSVGTFTGDGESGTFVGHSDWYTWDEQTDFRYVIDVAWD